MTRHRAIEGLRHAVPCPRPDTIPQQRPRGSKAAGLRYERTVAKALPHAVHSPWYHFIDNNGRGHCNPDLTIDLGDCIAVLECKLTDTWQAYAQIRELYAPVLRLAHQVPVIGVVVVHNLSPRTDRMLICTSLAEALVRARGGELPLLHWLGSGPI